MAVHDAGGFGGAEVRLAVAVALARRAGRAGRWRLERANAIAAAAHAVGATGRVIAADCAVRKVGRLCWGVADPPGAASVVDAERARRERPLSRCRDGRGQKTVNVGVDAHVVGVIATGPVALRSDAGEALDAAVVDERRPPRVAAARLRGVGRGAKGGSIDELDARRAATLLAPATRSIRARNPEANRAQGDARRERRRVGCDHFDGAHGRGDRKHEYGQVVRAAHGLERRVGLDPDNWHRRRRPGQRGPERDQFGPGRTHAMRRRQHGPGRDQRAGAVGHTPGDERDDRFVAAVALAMGDGPGPPSDGRRRRHRGVGATGRRRPDRCGQPSLASYAHRSAQAQMQGRKLPSAPWRWQGSIWQSCGHQMMSPISQIPLQYGL